MNRTTITAEVVANAEKMMAAGATQATIAAELGLTPYVVSIIDRYRGQKPCGKPIKHRPAHMRNSQSAIDATTIRMIQRMLEVGILSYTEIAREAGVSFNTVNDVAAGKRLAISKRKPYLQKGEQFLLTPIRCDVCHASILVAPCRACNARQNASAKKIRLTFG